MSDKLETTDAWPVTKIVKYILLPKPKDAPRAGMKEKLLRAGMASVFLVFALVWWLR